MKQRTVVPIWCFGVLFLSAGCYSSSQLPRDSIVPGADYDICEVTTVAGDTLALKAVSGRSGAIKDSIIIGVGENGKVVRMPLSRVQSVKIINFDAGEMMLAVLGVSAGVLLVTFWIFSRGG